MNGNKKNQRRYDEEIQVTLEDKLKRWKGEKNTKRKKKKRKKDDEGGEKERAIGCWSWSCRECLYSRKEQGANRKGRRHSFILEEDGEEEDFIPRKEGNENTYG